MPASSTVAKQDSKLTKPSLLVKVIVVEGVAIKVQLPKGY